MTTHVTIEACTAFEAADDDEPGVCLWCGWLDDDHDAVVVALDRRPPALAKAS